MPRGSTAARLEPTYDAKQNFANLSRFPRLNQLLGGEDDVTLTSKGRRRNTIIATATMAAWISSRFLPWKQRIGCPLYPSATNARACTDTASGRSEERRVGNGCVSTCRSRWSPHHKKQ